MPYYAGKFLLMSSYLLDTTLALIGNVTAGKFSEAALAAAPGHFR